MGLVPKIFYTITVFSNENQCLTVRDNSLTATEVGRYPTCMSLLINTYAATFV